jgi:hypothetical protein
MANWKYWGNCDDRFLIKIRIIKNPIRIFFRYCRNFPAGL